MAIKFGGNKDWTQGYFDNFDVFSNESLPYLYDFEIDYNDFTGSLTLSNGMTLPKNLNDFKIHRNQFSGTIQWNIFKGLYNLEQIEVDHNFFNGTIDWNVIADLVINGNLVEIWFDGNNFEGLLFCSFYFVYSYL